MVILGDEAVGNLYFEASALILALVLFGKSIENRAKQTALESLSLLELEPKQPPVSGPVRRSVSRQRVSIWRCFSNRAGERIGADGVVVKGEQISASAMTGVFQIQLHGRSSHIRNAC